MELKTTAEDRQAIRELHYKYQNTVFIPAVSEGMLIHLCDDIDTLITSHQWQSIESAPREWQDGRPLWGYRPDDYECGPQFLCEWDLDRQIWVTIQSDGFRHVWPKYLMEIPSSPDVTK